MAPALLSEIGLGITLPKQSIGHVQVQMDATPLLGASIAAACVVSLSIVAEHHDDDTRVLRPIRLARRWVECVSA